jgi:hypothetical protein
MTIQQYIHNKDMRRNTTALLKEGKWYRYIGGCWVPERQFLLMFPLQVKLNNNKENPSSRSKLLD